MKDSRRIPRLGGVWQALSAWRSAALAYILLLVLGYALLTPVFAWGQRRIDDLRYGVPRTVQLDGYVGHHEADGAPTHFVAFNLHRQISVLEFPGGDPVQVHVLTGPYLVGSDGEDVAPHLALRDINGDGRDDLALQLRDEVVYYINDQDTFRLITPAERAQLAQPQAHGP
jgi:hypothetical protein